MQRCCRLLTVLLSLRKIFVQQPNFRACPTVPRLPVVRSTSVACVHLHPHSKFVQHFISNASNVSCAGQPSTKNACTDTMHHPTSTTRTTVEWVLQSLHILPKLVRALLLIAFQKTSSHRIAVLSATKRPKPSRT